MESDTASSSASILLDTIAKIGNRGLCLLRSILLMCWWKNNSKGTCHQPNPKCKEFWKKGLDHCDLLGQLFNKSTANGFLQISLAQSAPNSDEERELDGGFLSAGVHVYLEADSGDDIEELTTPIEEQSRCTEMHVAQPEHSKEKKKKGEILSEMNEAIKGFMEVSKVRLIANES